MARHVFRPRIRRRFVLAACLVAAGFHAGVALAQDEGSPPAPIGEGPRVAEAVIATGIEDRRPVGEAKSFPAGTEELVCWTDVRGAKGTTIVHAWIHEGKTRARVEIEVRGPRWRCWSRKRLLPEWTGPWEVKVLTADGVVLETLDFVVE